MISMLFCIFTRQAKHYADRWQPFKLKRCSSPKAELIKLVLNEKM